MTDLTPVPAGTPTPAGAPTISTLCLSAVTHSAASTTEVSGVPASMFWRFVPTQSGVVVFDLFLTRRSDGTTGDPGSVDTFLQVYRSEPGETNVLNMDRVAWGDDANDPYSNPEPSSNRSQVNYAFEAGVTYYIVASKYDEDILDLDYYLRSSDYGFATDWTQPPDVTSVWSLMDQNNQTALAANHITSNAQSNWGYSPAITQSYFWQGNATFYDGHTAGYPNIRDDQAASSASRQCLWHAARAMGDVTPAEAGDDIYYKGICPTDEGQNTTWAGSESQGTSVIAYEQRGFFLIFSQTWFSRIASQNLTVRFIEDAMGASAGSTAAQDALVAATAAGGSGYIQYETDHCEMVGLAVAPDEYDLLGDTVSDITSRDFPVTWRMQRMWAPDSEWGPQPTEEKSVTMRGASAGPESLPAIAEPYDGGLAEWIELTDEIAPARAYEETIPLTYYGDPDPAKPSFVFMPVPPVFESDIEPYAGFAGGDPQSWAARRSHQFLAVRTVIRPTRYKLVVTPPIVEATVTAYFITPNLDADLRDSGAVFS